MGNYGELNANSPCGIKFFQNFKLPSSLFHRVNKTKIKTKIFN